MFEKTIKKTVDKTIFASLWFADYIYVILFYLITAFIFAVIIDGYILGPYNDAYEKTKPTWRLFLEVSIQFAVQGFISIFINIVLHKIGSPINGVAKYDIHAPFSELLRNPAIVSIILFAMSETLIGRIKILFKRLKANAQQLSKPQTFN